MRRAGAGAGVGVVAVLLAVVLCACVPGPVVSPSASGSGFVDEDAAFAAAEATYRAYVDALNRVDLSDPETFEDVYQWTTGDALAEEKESLSTMHAEGWSVSGESRIDTISAVDVASDLNQGTVIACTDVSGVTLVDAGGVSQVSSDRPSVQTIRVSYVADSSSPTGAKIGLLSPLEGVSPCA